MSGNTTRLGVDLARDPATGLVPLLLIAGFVSGVALGAVAAGLAGPFRKRAVLALVSGLLLGAAAGQGHLPHALGLALLVLAMGVLNNTFLRDGEVSVGLTYMILGALAFGHLGEAALWLAAGWALLMLGLAWRLTS